MDGLKEHVQLATRCVHGMIHDVEHILYKYWWSNICAFRYDIGWHHYSDMYSLQCYISMSSNVVEEKLHSGRSKMNLSPRNRRKLRKQDSWTRGKFQHYVMDRKLLIKIRDLKGTDIMQSGMLTKRLWISNIHKNQSYYQVARWRALNHLL